MKPLRRPGPSHRRLRPSVLLVLLLPALLLPITGCQTKNAAEKAIEERRDTFVAGEDAQRAKKNYSSGGSAAPYSGAPGWNPSITLGRGTVGGSASYSRVATSQPYVAMTFDDGPHPSHTPRLLDIMKERNIKATFYVVGTNARRYPNILRRMIAEGHEIGNHTQTHIYISRAGEAKSREEIILCHQAITDATGVPPLTIRPPYGAITSAQKSWIKAEFNYPSIMWSVDPQDWKRPGASVVARRLVSGAHPGAILLAHDIHGPTIDAMPRAFDELLAKGYQFVTVTQLISLEST